MVTPTKMNGETDFFSINLINYRIMKHTNITKILLSALMLVPMTAFAGNDDDTRQTLIVNDVEVKKTVSEIRFDGNNVLLQFSDSTLMEVDMQLVSLTMTYDELTGIQLRLESDEDVRIYDLKGRRVNKKDLRKGAYYIIDGKKYFNKK